MGNHARIQRCPRRHPDQCLVRIQTAGDHYPFSNSHSRNQPRRPGKGRDEEHRTDARQILRRRADFSHVSPSEQLEVSSTRIAHGPLRAGRKAHRGGRRGRFDVCPAAWATARFRFRKMARCIQVASSACTWAIALAKCLFLPANDAPPLFGAERDCEVMEISKPAMAAVLRDAPECRDATERIARDPQDGNRRPDQECLRKTARKREAEGIPSHVLAAGFAPFSNCKGAALAGIGPGVLRRFETPRRSRPGPSKR